MYCFRKGTFLWFHGISSLFTNCPGFTKTCVLRSLNKNNVRKFAEKERGVAAKKRSGIATKEGRGIAGRKRRGNVRRERRGIMERKGRGIMEGETSWKQRGGGASISRSCPGHGTSVLLIQQFLDTLISHCLASPLDSLWPPLSRFLSNLIYKLRVIMRN